MGKEGMEANQESGQKPAKTPEVSVIVPVCNVENYLRQCLDSLRAQTLENMEFLLVDDGSKDSCPQILEEEAPRDPRMKVISKKNGGYGSAINAGLAQAKGRYVGIVEPDDFIDAYMYEDLLAASVLPGGKSADVVKSSYWEYYDIPGREPYMERPNLMNCMPKTSFAANVKDEFEVLFHHPSVWSAIYRREFLEAHDIHMMEVPGGGWVDNPFFFETLLQAEEFVWVPAAYYYYRQTNPNSSSNLKNYHMPYDRLRDIRAIFERLHVTDPQILACLYARHFYYTFSVIGEWGFSEKDPELLGLIREAMQAVDRKILYGGYRGIPKKYLLYYESIVEDPAQHIRERKEPAGKPQVSVIVPMMNDRHDLTNTFNDLAEQSLDRIEIVCADGGSKDLGFEIASAFAERDARFKALKAEGIGYDAALAAGLAAATAPLVMIVLPGQRVPKNYLKTAVETMKESADLDLFLAKKQRTFFSCDQDGAMDADGIEAELVLCAAENPAGCLFRREVLKKVKTADDSGDSRLLLFLFESINVSRKVSIHFGETPSAGIWGKIFKAQTGRRDLDVCSDNLSVLDAVKKVSDFMDANAQRAFRSLAVRRLLDDERAFIYSDQGREIHALLKDAFYKRYELPGSPQSSYCNVEAYLALEQDVCSSYADTLCRETESANAASSRIRSRQASIQNSRSYRIAYGVLQTVRKVKRRFSQRKNS